MRQENLSLLGDCHVTKKHHRDTHMTEGHMIRGLRHVEHLRYSSSG